LKFWKTIRALQNEKVNSLPHQFKIGNAVITEQRDMLNTFNDHFEKVVHIFEDILGETSLVQVVSYSASALTFDLAPFFESDVLQSIDSKKAAGTDELDPVLLKMAA